MQHTHTNINNNINNTNTPTHHTPHTTTTTTGPLVKPIQSVLKNDKFVITIDNPFFLGSDVGNSGILNDDNDDNDDNDGNNDKRKNCHKIEKN